LSAATAGDAAQWTLLDGEHPPRDQRPREPRHPTPDVRGDHAGMQRVGGHAGTVEAPGQLHGEQHVAQLGDRVLALAGQGGRGPPEGAEVDAGRPVVGRARHVDDPGIGTARRQPLKQQRRQGEVAQVVHAEVQLEPVGGRAALPADPGVIHQHVQGLAGGTEGVRARADRVERRQVEGKQPHASRAGGRLDRRHRRLACRGRAARDVNPSALAGERGGRREADPGVAAGNEERPPARAAPMVGYSAGWYGKLAHTGIIGSGRRRDDEERPGRGTGGIHRPRETVWQDNVNQT
jgi:hypothetical protein